MQTSEPTKREIRVALAFTFIILFGVVVLKAASLEEAQRYDFSNFYAAGWMIRHGDGSNLYNVQEQARVQEELFKGRGFLLELHPPFEELLYAPLTLLSYRSAYIVWGMINITFWMAFVHLMRPFAPVPRQTFQYFALCFTFFPVWIALHHGQPSVLLLVLFCLTFLSLKNRQDFKAGAFLGLGLFKFHLVLPLVLIFALRRKWKFVAGFVSAGILLGLLSIIAVGPTGVLAYVNLISSVVSHPTNPIYATIKISNMPILRGFFSVLMGERIGLRWANATVALASALLVLFTAWRWRQEDRLEGGASLELMFAAAVVISLITGFSLFVHDLSPMLLAILLVIGSPQWRERSGSRLVLVSCIATLYIPLVYLLLIDWGKMFMLCPVLLLFALGIFGLLGKSASIARDDRSVA